MIALDFDIPNYEELQIMVSEINKEDVYRKICKNVKKFRLEKYCEFKKNSYSNVINPYTTENVSSLLDYNHNYYKRFESENDETKVIPLIKLIKLSVILDKDISDFLK